MKVEANRGFLEDEGRAAGNPTIEPHLQSDDQETIAA